MKDIKKKIKDKLKNIGLDITGFSKPLVHEHVIRENEIFLKKKFSWRNEVA